MEMREHVCTDIFAEIAAVYAEPLVLSLILPFLSVRIVCFRGLYDKRTFRVALHDVFDDLDAVAENSQYG